MKKIPILIFPCKSILIFLLLFFISLQAIAQIITNYTFTASNGTFTALSTPNATSWTGNTNDGVSGLIPIGFDFWYMGKRYENISASTNGWVGLGTALSDDVNINDLSSGGSPRPVIAPLWDNLDIVSNANVTYKTSGTAGSRIFTIQYLNVKWGALALGGVISFQVKLYEGAGTIEFVYRPEAALISQPTASIGITATSTGSGNFLSVNDGGTGASSTNEASVITSPVSGKTYRFTPSAPMAPGALTFSGTGYRSMTLNWSDQSSDETGFVIYRSTDGTNYKFASQTSANVISSSQTDLLANTTYYWRIYTLKEGALSTALAGSQATAAYAQIPDLASAASFVLFTTNGQVGNTGLSQITGDIGADVGAIVGFETATVNGNIYAANAVTAQCSADLVAAYNQLSATTTTVIHAAVLGNGETVLPGVYTMAAAASIAGQLTLDAQGDPDAVFIFKVGAAFTTGAATTVSLINGAAACNVFWIADGAISMAASTIMRGTLISNNGAISMAAGGTLEGRMFSTTGAVSVDAVLASIPICLSGVWTGAVSSIWNVAGNWLSGVIPTTATNTTIPSGVPNYPLLDVDTGSVKNITIQSNASLTVTDGTLQIAGSINNSGTLDVSGGAINMNGSSPQTIPVNAFESDLINDLTINNGAGVTLGGTLYLSGILLASNGQLNTGGHLTLISTATQTALIDGSGTGEVLGNVTMQRYLPSGFGYKYFSSPFQSATINEFSDEVDLGASFSTFYHYDEDRPASGWISDTNPATMLIPMWGYSVNMGASAAAKTVDVTGIVNNQTISSPTLYNHNRPYTLGFNLVGNPYPSPIDWDATAGWSRSNIDNAVYYFNSGVTSQYTGTYSSYINGISSDGIAGPVIAAMQGFFVHVSDGAFPVTATLGINNNARINNLVPDFHRELPLTMPLLRLTAGFADESTVSDHLVVYFDDNASMAFDKEMDALKLMNTDVLSPSLYARSPDKTNLSICAWPALNDSTTSIPLGLEINRSGWITFNARDIERVPNGRHIYLYDSVTGKEQDLLDQQPYRLNLEAGKHENRFFLTFRLKDTLSPPVATIGVFNVYSTGNKLYAHISELPVEKCDVAITDVAGKVVMRKQLNGNGYHQLGSQFSSGMYIVSFYTPARAFTQKVFISN
jgi:hypothetical protein